MQVQNQQEHDQYRKSCQAKNSNDWLHYECYYVHFRFKVESGPNEGYWRDGEEIYYAKGKGSHKAVEARWNSDYSHKRKRKTVTLKSIVYQ